MTVSPTTGPATTGPATTGPATGAGSPARVVSARVAYQWHWPNDAARPGVVRHEYGVPPTPALIRIGAGDHPSDRGERPFNRMSFTFSTAMPGYTFQFADELAGDGSGRPIPVAGHGVLRITFRQARAHTADGTASTVVTQPVRPLGMAVMADYAPAGDYEGVLTYGIGVGRAGQGNPQPLVRAYEVVRAVAGGSYEYTVAIDIAAR
ncbi:AMIN-like domain-containing (lipo)protein [Dactylosporangium sp. CA-092794]|uniref:AMIN-like domain-containing (lipo)protein n=1 Tax=Dactylosporangium sp. CA-092794 TaxID=3239929 RepID=UPI003D8A1A62